MDKKQLSLILSALILTIALILIVGHILRQREPLILQGTAECRSYKAASKIAGRITSMSVSEGQQVTKGELLYTLSTPELDAKLRQAEAAKSAAAALDQRALLGSRKQLIEEARNLWQKAQAGRVLAQKTFSRVEALYTQGVVATQKFDEAEANLQAAIATESAAKAQYDLALAGATLQDKEAATAQLRQAEGAVSEVESYIDDAAVYSPTDGQVATIISQVGELVGSGFPVLTILDTQDSWITFNIKESLLPHFNQGTRFDAYIPALDCDITLEVTFISPQADFATWSATRAQGGFDIRTFSIKATPVIHHPRLHPGMSALVNLKPLIKQ